MLSGTDDRGGVRALERGLAVIRSFSDKDRPLTMAEVARESGLDRAVVRRILGSLERLGYLSVQDGRFALRARVLELGYSYLSSDPLPRIAAEHLRPFADRIGESCSAGVLENDTVIYIARAEVRRISGPTLAVGTAIAPYLSTIGRVLLAELDDGGLEQYLRTAALRPLTDRTITDPEVLRAELHRVREQQYCVIDQELELGVLAAAVPIRYRSGRLAMAINVTSHTSRASVPSVTDELLPALRTVQQAMQVDLMNTEL